MWVGWVGGGKGGEGEWRGARVPARGRHPPHHPTHFLSPPQPPALAAALAAGANPNEVEAAGTTPLHCAAYGGWEAGVRTLVAAGAKVAASNNAGDRAWHWAVNMGHEKVAAVLVEVSGEREKGGRQFFFFLFFSSVADDQTNPALPSPPPVPIHAHTAGLPHHPGRRHRAGPRAQSERLF